MTDTGLRLKNDLDLHWLVGCFGFNGPLRQYFSLYQAVSQREGEREENVQTTPTRTYCERRRPLSYCIQMVGRPGTGSLPSTIAPPDHPRPTLQKTVFVLIYLTTFINFCTHIS